MLGGHGTRDRGNDNADPRGANIAPGQREEPIVANQNIHELRRSIDEAFDFSRVRGENERDARDRKGTFLQKVVRLVLEAQGHETQMNESSFEPDGGVDIRVKSSDTDYSPAGMYVEVEFRTKPVSARKVKGLVDQLRSDGVARGIYVAWGGFRQARDGWTPPARLVERWDADRLLSLVTERGLEGQVWQLVREYRLGQDGPSTA